MLASPSILFLSYSFDFGAVRMKDYGSALIRSEDFSANGLNSGQHRNGRVSVGIILSAGNNGIFGLQSLQKVDSA